MAEDRIEFLASGSESGEKPADHDRLELIRAILDDEAVWSEPPHEVGDALIEAIAREAEPGRPNPRSTVERWPWAAAVAVAAGLALFIGLTVVTTDPDEIVVAMEGTELEAAAAGEATLRPTGDGWWIGLEVSDLPPAGEGTYYEGWVWSDDGDGVSIGTFHLRGEGANVVLWSGVDPTNYPMVWVTLEDEDGDPSASDRIVMRGRITDDQMP